MRTHIKRVAEFGYWVRRFLSEGRLTNDHYQYFFTSHFGLDRDYYTGRTVLDVGCGPRGSLEWADHTSERIGLDPLANKYRRLGAGAHRMSYVKGNAEAIPFPNNYFDVVASFNSLDHVDDLDTAVREICRVVKQGGLFLLLADVHHRPTITEPLALSWDVVDRFTPELHVVDVRRYEKVSSGMYDSLVRGQPYDERDPRQRYGIISARLSKPYEP